MVQRARAHGLPTARPLIVIMLATILREIDAGIAIFIAVATAILLKECAEAVAGSAGAGDRGSLGIAALLLVSSAGRISARRAARAATPKPVLAVDLDEVCCGYLPAFCKFSNAVHGTSVEAADFHSYMFWEVAGCRLASREAALDRVYEFHASDFFARIEPLPGAAAALRLLRAKFELHVVTSRQSDIEPQTRAFLARHFEGLFTAAHFGNHFGREGAKTSKPEMCKRIGAVALVDDSLTYARQCAAAGIPTLLFGAYPWNATDEALDLSIRRVARWQDVLAELLVRSSRSATATQRGGSSPPPAANR